MSATMPELSCLDYLAPVFTKVGMALETNPEAWSRLWEFPAVRAISYIDVPAPFNPYPFELVRLGHDGCPYGLYLAIVEYLARFDASCLLALPGPSLCTHVLLALGTEAQNALFFERFRSTAAPHWTFLAVTEPGGGSDALTMRSHLAGSGDDKRLNAEKMFIGSLQRASIGLVVARGDNQELCLAMIEPDRHPESIKVEKLPVFGLAGAGLCRLVVRDCLVSADQVIGWERKSLRDGLNVISNVFERHRPMVGALALGAANGLLDALEDSGMAPRIVAKYKLEHAALCQVMNRLAQRYTEGRLRGHEASLFKLEATRFTERVACSVPRHLSATAILNSPSLRKKYRDISAFEYMEGTSHMQLLNGYRSYVASREHYDAAS